LPPLRPYLRHIAGKAPLAPAAVGLLVGIALDRALAPPALLPLAVLGAVALAMATPRIRRREGVLLVMAALAACGAGMLLHHRQIRHLGPESVLHHWQGRETTARIRGRIATPPRVIQPPQHLFANFSYGAPRTTFLLRLEAIETANGFHPATGMLRVGVNEPALDLEQGERVEMFGTLYRFQPPANPGGFDWALYYRRQGVHAGFACPHAAGVIRVAPAEIGAARFVEAVRRWAAGLLTDDIAASSPEEASMLEAMIIGHRSQLDQHLNDVFIRAGCIHFLAVSGVNVGITMALAGTIGRLLTLRRRPRTWLMLLSVLAYAVISEARPPILRATVIGVIYCVARLTGRERATLNWIAATVIALGVFDPAMIFDAGYQLSTAAVLGVIYLAPALDEAISRSIRRLRGRPARRDDVDEQLIAAVQRDQAAAGGWVARVAAGVPRAAATAITLSIGAWLAAAPIGLMHFQQLQPYGAINTLLLMPLVTVVMAGGMAKFLLAIAFPTVANLITPLLQGADALLIGIVEVLAQVPGASMNVASPPWYAVLLFYLLLLGMVFRYGPAVAEEAEDGDAPPLSGPAAPALAAGAGRFRAPRLPRAAGAPVALCAAGVLAGAITWHLPDRQPGDLRITCLAAGRGSSTLIELPDGTAIVYDAGASGPYDPGRGTFVPMLHERGLTRIDALYISHPNLDHFSGVPSLIEMVDCGPVVLNADFVALAKERSPARVLLDHLTETGHPVQIGPTGDARRWQQGGVTFEWLWPDPEGTKAATPNEPGPDSAGPSRPSIVQNDASTVLRLSFGGRSILLTGDIDVETQKTLIARGDLKADVLLLPHHGAVVASTADFIAAVGAEVLIRSTNEPLARTDEALLRLVRGRRYHSTADAGAVEVRLGPAGVSVTTMR
jgi:competence protein ComEC